MAVDESVIEENLLIEAFVVAQLLPNVRNIVRLSVLFTSCVKL